LASYSVEIIFSMGNVELCYRATSNDTASAGMKVEGRITVLLAYSMMGTITSSLYWQQ
jgi:hypothetical protein